MGYRIPCQPQSLHAHLPSFVFCHHDYILLQFASLLLEPRKLFKKASPTERGLNLDHCTTCPLVIRPGIVDITTGSHNSEALGSVLSCADEV